MWLNVNGETRQNGTTKTMIFGVAHLVWYCSQFFVLEPGDIIITGTPPGVGLGMKPPQFLKAGDVVRARHRRARRAEAEGGEVQDVILDVPLVHLSPAGRGRIAHACGRNPGEGEPSD